MSANDTTSAQTRASALQPPPPVTTVNPKAADGATIAQINFRADAGFDTTMLSEDVTLEPGQPVTIRELQTSIKNLFSTGNFRDIRVDSQKTAEGVVLTFALFLNYRIDDIELAGIGGRDRNRAQREMTIRPGQVLSLNAVDDSAAAIEEALNRSGFLEATVDPVTNFDRARSIADVKFDITPGPRATIANVVLEGDLAPFTAPQLIAPMKRDVGHDFDLLEAREDAERIQRFLIRRKHRRARVEYLGNEYDDKTHAVTLRYRVSVGPTVQVAVQGVPQKSVRRWLPFRGRYDEYSEDAVDRSADQIVSGLQARGHYNAAVETESKLENNVWTTTFIVSPGPLYRLSAVSFSGNRQVDEEDLAKVVQTSPRGGIKRTIASLFRRPQGVTREQLGADQDAVESFYRLQGFSEVAVGEPVVTTNDGAGLMTVDFPITEGPQTLVTDVKIEGNEQVAAQDLPEPQLKTGEPLNPQLAHEDVVALQSFYAERGHVEVQVQPRVAISDDKTKASVTYTITEGPQVSFGEVTVRGNTYTDRDVVLRRADIERQTPFTYTRILEAQRELYRLGIFQRVDIQPEQADVTPQTRNVVIQVEEGKNLTLTGAVGLRVERGRQDARVSGQEDTPNAQADITSDEGTDINERIAIAAAHRNLFGTGRYLGLEAVLSRDEQEFFITYREPFISRWNVPVQLQIFQSDDNTRPGVHILQRGTSIEATKVALQRTRWSLRYEYKISDCLEGDLCALLKADDDDDPTTPPGQVPVEGLDRSLSNIQISSINPTFFWDTRDDIIDPHRGFFTSASLEYAFPFISAEANFLKEYVQGAVYLPISARTVVALSSRIGLIQALGDTHSDDVPLSERFTAGGENSHRAFRLDRLGTYCYDANDVKIADCVGTLFRRRDPDTGVAEGPILPLGGSGLLLLNAEYRFPIFGPVGGAVFGDVGNVFADSKIRFDDLRYGVGMGLRYLSPVGPLRIDVGFPLERRHYEDAFVYFISLGYAF